MLFKSLFIKPPSLSDRGFFASLHGLRGIAVLYVVASHLGIGGLFLLPIPHDAIGKVGVWIFFVLSAFLLTTHLFCEFESTDSKLLPLLQYAIHRIFRIYPLFIFALIIHVILGDISIAELGKHVLLIQGSRELWAIPVEFQYYFIIPAVAIGALYLPRRTITLLLLACMALVVLYGQAQPASVFSNGLNILPKLIPFLFGSLLALLLHKKNLPKPDSKSGFTFLIPISSLGMLFIGTVLYRSISKGGLPIFFAPWLSIAIGASVAGLIFSALHMPVINRILAVKPLVFLGEISFSVYLLHLTVIRFVQNLPGLSAGNKAWLALTLSILCASITYWAIERPGIRAGKHIGQKLRNRHSKAIQGHHVGTAIYVPNASSKK